MKTIEEAAEDFTDNYDGVTGCFAIDGNSSFSAGVKFAQQWISVTEELPEMSEDEGYWDFGGDDPVKCSEYVLLKNEYEIIVGGMDENKEWFDHYGKVADITHWRPIELK